MSGGTVTVSKTAETASQELRPPIALLLPLLHSILSASLLFFRLAFNFLLTLTSPLHIPWSIIRLLLAPVLTAAKITLDFCVFTPFSIIRAVAIALYPIYVFCAAACLFGATVGIFGHYISTMIQNALPRSKYFAPGPPSTVPPLAAPPPPSQVTLRKRKRRSVRMQ